MNRSITLFMLLLLAASGCQQGSRPEPPVGPVVDGTPVPLASHKTKTRVVDSSTFALDLPSGDINLRGKIPVGKVDLGSVKYPSSYSREVETEVQPGSLTEAENIRMIKYQTIRTKWEKEGVSPERLHQLDEEFLGTSSSPAQQVLPPQAPAIPPAVKPAARPSRENASPPRTAPPYRPGLYDVRRTDTQLSFLYVPGPGEASCELQVEIHYHNGTTWVLHHHDGLRYALHGPRTVVIDLWNIGLAPPTGAWEFQINLVRESRLVRVIRPWRRT